MHLLVHSAFLKALGWALLNSLWQFGLLWLLIVVFLNRAPGRSAARRHQAVLVAIFAGFTWFLLELLLAYLGSPIMTLANPLAFIPYYKEAQSSLRSLIDNNLSYLSAGYLVVVGLLFIRFAGYFRQLHLLKTQGVSKLNASLRVYVEQLVQQLSIHRKVQVWLSEKIDTPMILGFLRPTILLPVASINQLSVKQLEAILLHELIHIKRNDYPINTCVACIGIVLFFNPFARLMVRSIKQEREKRCDDWVLQFRFDPLQYASALFTLEKSRLNPVGVGIAATGTSERFLLTRIERIMGMEPKPAAPGVKPMAFLCLVLLVAMTALVNPAEKVAARMGTLLVKKSLQPAWISVRDSITRFANAPERPGVVIPERTMAHTPRTSSPTAAGLDTASDNRADLNTEMQAFSVSNLMPQEVALDAAHEVYSARAITSKAVEFSMVNPESPSVPPVPVDETTPFVPKSSFSYTVPVDTAVRPKKMESYAEHKAQEAMIKAQKALKQIDWKKIEASMQQSKTSMQAVKNQIEESLKALNWQQINQEVNDSLNAANNQRLRLVLKKDYDSMKVYKDLQQQFETIQQSLKRQEQQYRLESEKKMMEIQRQLGSKKITVHI